MGHAFETGNAVVHGQQHVGALLQGQVDDGRREAVAVHGAIGHDVEQRARHGAEQAQAAQRNGTSGGAVAVVVGDDAEALLCSDGIGKETRRGLRAEQFGRRQQARQAVVELVGAAHAAGCEQARQQRVHTGLLQRPCGAWRHVAQAQRRRRR